MIAKRGAGWRWRGAAVALAVAALLAGLTAVLRAERPGAPPSATASPPPLADPSQRASAPPDAAPVEPEAPAPPTAWVDRASVGQPYGTSVEGLITFRGNPTRTYYGRGPVPADPEVAWSYPPDGRLCGSSTVGGRARQWCGTGWTGQPAVFVRDGRTWVVFGAYDHRVHFLDAADGRPILPPFPTGDLVKGSVTVDPDGFPLVYAGSRDGYYRVLALDRSAPVELWSLSADGVAPTLWNDDWDGAGLVLDDHLFVGGENSRFHIVKLNRGYDGAGQVTVAPEVVFDVPGWDGDLLADLGDGNVSIEGSVAISGDTVYFANSGGLVQGWDIGGLTDGQEPQRVFRFWTGDDTDATVVVDADGMLYVASQWERFTPRSRGIGQVMKLDPSRPEDPLVWSVRDRDLAEDTAGGVWATPALHRDVLYVATDAGRLFALDRDDGRERWSVPVRGPAWQSPVVVDDVLIQGDCAGVLRAYDVRDTSLQPPQLWSRAIGGCIESTPAVWDGSVYVGTRAGQVVALRDPPGAGERD